MKDECDASKIPEIEGDDIIAVDGVTWRVPFYAFNQPCGCFSDFFSCLVDEREVWRIKFFQELVYGWL